MNGQHSHDELEQRIEAIEARLAAHEACCQPADGHDHHEPEPTPAPER